MSSGLLFVYENIVIIDKTDIEKANRLMCHLDGAVFDYNYESFSSSGRLSPAGNDFQDVKQSIIYQFDRITEPEYQIRPAISATIDEDKILKSVREMDSYFAKAIFND